MLIYDFESGKMEKVAMPDWLREMLSLLGTVAGRILRRIAVGTAIAITLTALSGKGRRHTRIGLPSVSKPPSTSRLFRTKTIRRRKW